jgi:hypothetical protein
LDQAPLAAADKDVDHIALVTQPELRLPRDSSSGTHTATASLLATTEADSASSHIDSLGSPLLAHTVLRPACSCLAGERGGPPLLAVPGQMGISAAVVCADWLVLVMGSHI